MSDGKIVFEITGDVAGIDEALQTATDLITRHTSGWTALAQVALSKTSSLLKSSPVGQVGAVLDELAPALDEIGAVQLPAEWHDGTEGALQSALSGMQLRVPVSVQPVVSPVASGGWFQDLFSPWSGQSHATGGIFHSATRVLAGDGLHTVGESGPELLLPLDAFWRRMGMGMDQALSENLSALHYSIMPPMTSFPLQASEDESRSNAATDRMLRALSGLTVEMDKKTVGRILKPVMSREIAGDVKNRRWTS